MRSTSSPNSAQRPAHGALWSHEETGNGWTYARDRRVAAWARANGVIWREAPQGGVIRRLKTRNGWGAAWDRCMAEAIAPTPRIDPVAGLESHGAPSAAVLGLRPDPCPERQVGGATQGSGSSTVSSTIAPRRTGAPCRRRRRARANARACRRISPSARFPCVKSPRRPGRASAR